jgi:hypothetical protein
MATTTTTTTKRSKHLKLVTDTKDPELAAAEAMFRRRIEERAPLKTPAPANQPPLQPAQAAPQRREQSAMTFARIPHDFGDVLGRSGIGGAAWTLLVVLDRLIFEGRGKNPVKLTTRAREAAGLSRHAMRHGLAQLAKVGVINVEQRPGQAPVVEHLWFPRP